MAPSEKLTLDDLCQKATEFARKTWTSRITYGWSIGQMSQVEVNPGLQLGCPALQNYCEGYRRLDDFVDAKSCTFFAWHGTPQLSNIASICHHGFSPDKRKRQVCGPGEYFGVVPEDSHNFSGNTDRLIVAQIIKCKHVRTLQNCHVVDNPKTQKYTFSLPVLVIAYGSSARLPIPWIQAPALAIPSPFLPSQPVASKRAGALWKWTKDDGSLEPFDAKMNSAIEHHYRKYRMGGSHTFTTSPITRYCDKTTQQYMIDFVLMIQENQSTRFRRCIKRRSQKTPWSVKPRPSSWKWHWTKDGGSPEPYPDSVSNLIEHHYQLHVKGGPLFFDLPGITRMCDKAVQSYTIDFGPPMTQTNQATDYQRKLTRVRQVKPAIPSLPSSPAVQPKTSHWQWHWLKDDRRPEPYSNSESNLIEHHYQLHVSGGPQSFQLAGIIRQCDNVAQTYIISFSTPMTQTNRNTLFVRHIQRTSRIQSRGVHQHSNTPCQQVKPKASPYRWHWTKDDGSSELFPDTVCNLIEHHYQLYAKGGPQSFQTPALTRQCDGLPQMYIIDFSMPFSQTNRKTGFTRRVSRTMPTNVSPPKRNTETYTSAFVNISQNLESTGSNSKESGNASILETKQKVVHSGARSAEILPPESTTSTSSDRPAVQEAMSPLANVAESDANLQVAKASSETARTWLSPVLELVAGMKALFWMKPSDEIDVGKDCLEDDELITDANIAA